jgi:hypothetical protein
MSMEDEWACASLCYRYALYADRARERVASLFTEDGTLELPRRKLVGREAILGDFKPRPGTVTLHYCTNIVVEIIDSENARGTTHLLSLGHESDKEITAFPLPMPVARTGGIYHDTYFRQDGVWLFRSRRLEAVFKGPG